MRKNSADPTIAINGVKYKLTTDRFSTILVDGKTVDEFTKWLEIYDPVGYEEAFNKGIKTITESPDLAEDIIERHELPFNMREIKEFLKIV